MHLYDQLLSLQELPNAPTEWAAYRRDLTHFISQQVIPTSRIAILGAGHCNDLDLSLLSQQVASITLIDKNAYAMQKALKHYDLQPGPHLSLHVCDLVGISDAMYRHYADTLMAKVRQSGLATSVDELATLAHSLLDVFESVLKQPLALGDARYDAVIAVGLHSQLLSMLEWIWSIILQTLQKEEATVREKIITMNTCAVERLNTALFQLTEKTLIIGYEKERLGRPGTIQGAIQCALDLTSRNHQGDCLVRDAKVLQWPFDLSKQVVYAMQLVALEKPLDNLSK